MQTLTGMLNFPHKFSQWFSIEPPMCVKFSVRMHGTVIWFDVGRQSQRTDKGPLVCSLAATSDVVRTIQTLDHFFSLTPTAFSRHTFPIFVFTGYLLIYFIHQLLRKQVVTRTLLCYTQVQPVVTLLKTPISLLLIGIKCWKLLKWSKGD